MKRTMGWALAGLLALALPAAAHIPLDKRVCVIGVSKEMCGVRLSGGNWGPYICSDPDFNQCQTLTGLGANVTGFMGGAGSTCDEVPDWNLTAVVDVNARRQLPMPGRGSWTGSYQLTDTVSGAVVATGRLNGTLGVGTHRPVCGGACGKDCERCHDAQPDPTQTVWTLGSEGFMDGEFTAGRYRGCHIRWSFQGDFTTQGDANGPLQPNYSWGFCGNVDGVIECPCQLLTP